MSASAVAFNTYFKKKRRIAASYQYGVSGLGPILLPYFATFLVSSVGVRYTVVCFAGLSLNTIACSLVYQPVKWHVKNPDEDAEASKKLTTSEDKETFDSESLNKVSFRNRVGSRKKTDRVPSSSIDMAENSELKSLKDNSDGPNVNPDKSLELKMEETRHSVRNEGKSIEQNLKAKRDKKDDDKPMQSWLANIVAFFDLDLLRDISYMNLVIGLTLINFVEINFAILTPFILSDFGFKNQQIALAMTLLGVCDLVVRFLVPLITSKIHLSNKVFFAFGLLGMSVGRLLLSFTSDFYTLIGVFLWLGLSKGFRTVFWGLIIPGYVPLKKLPAAVGIQRLISGLFSLACGPLIGKSIVITLFKCMYILIAFILTRSNKR